MSLWVCWMRMSLLDGDLRRIFPARVVVVARALVL